MISKICRGSFLSFLNGGTNFVLKKIKLNRISREKSQNARSLFIIQIYIIIYVQFWAAYKQNK